MAHFHLIMKNIRTAYFPASIQTQDLLNETVGNHNAEVTGNVLVSVMHV
jgi:hypothetical protein